MGQPPRSSRPRPFRLHEWLILPELHRISGHGETIQIEPRLIDVLVHLAEHAGRVITRDELMDAVWGTARGSRSTIGRPFGPAAVICLTPDRMPLDEHVWAVPEG